jgi:hypothetical protein
MPVLDGKWVLSALLAACAPTTAGRKAAGL